MPNGAEACAQCTQRSREGDMASAADSSGYATGENLAADIEHNEVYVPRCNLQMRVGEYLAMQPLLTLADDIEIKDT